MDRIIVIKATKRQDMWDYTNNKPIEDNVPIGFVMDVQGSVPESFIKWVPNKIFDKRKYPELYAIFGKDHLPNDLELKCYVQKHWDEWHNPKNKFSLSKFIFKICMSIIGLIFALIIMYAITLFLVR